jgi:energy-converting hydrogenase A subunit R
MKLIFFDLEGPLSPQDNAYELMKLAPQGDMIFEVISRYDDLLALEGKEGYEPGDTLALIAPFLVYHGISEGNIVTLAEKASLVAGAQELIGQLHTQGRQVFCISTSYEQYARRIAQRVGIALENVACTHFPLDLYHSTLSQEDFSAIERVERDILALRPEEDDAKIKERLDHFFWLELTNTKLGAIIEEVRPVGGRRKVVALSRFAQRFGQSLGGVAVVGDSITDAKMLEAVDKSGGLAIAFNANQYALTYATIGLASTHLSDLGPVLAAWADGGRDAAEKEVRAKESTSGTGNRGYYHWLAGRRDLDEPLAIHRRMRRIVREEAGKLG